MTVAGRALAQDGPLPEAPQLVLTQRDHAILCGIAAQRLQSQPAYLALLAERLQAELVADHSLLPTGTAHLGSRIRYRIAGGGLLEQRLVIGGDREALGETCSVRTLRGITLLGMRAGQQALLAHPRAEPEEIMVEEVLKSSR